MRKELSEAQKARDEAVASGTSSEADLKAELESVRKKLHETVSAHAHSEAGRSSKNDNAVQWKRRCEDLQKELDRAREAIETANDAAEKKRKKITDGADGTNHDLKILTSELQSAKEAKDQLAEELQSAKEAKDRLAEELQSAKEAKDRLTGELVAAREDMPPATSLGNMHDIRSIEASERL